MRWWTFDGLTDYGVNIQEQSYRRRWLSLIRNSGGYTVHFLIGNCLEASSACYQEPPHVASTALSPLYKGELAQLPVLQITIFLVNKSSFVVRDYGAQE